MLSCIDENKFYELGVGMFGIISVYLIYEVIYQRAIYQHYQSSQTDGKEIFASETGFVFLEQFFAWILIQAFAFVSLKKQSYVQIPIKYTLSCGLLSSASLILFTYGIFQISFISSMLHKCLAYPMITLFMFLIGSKFLIKRRLPKRIDFVMSKTMLIGALMFWVYADQTWFFTENKSGHFYAYIIVISALLDAFLSMTQIWICQNYQPTEIQLLLNVSRWTTFFSFLFMTLNGYLLYTIKFYFTYYEFAFAILSLSGLYFVGQFFLYRITTKMAVNVPLFIVTSKNILSIHENYALSRHKIGRNQVIGMAISWLSIIIQAFVLVHGEGKENAKNPIEVQMSEEIDQQSLDPI